MGFLIKSLPLQGKAHEETQHTAKLRFEILQAIAKCFKFGFVEEIVIVVGRGLAPDEKPSHRSAELPQRGSLRTAENICRETGFRWI